MEMKEDEKKNDNNSNKDAVDDRKQMIQQQQKDPLLREPSKVVREGDWVVLLFGDGRQYMVQCSRKGKVPNIRINKRGYSPGVLVGLQYGTVLEVGTKQLHPLPFGEGLLPDFPKSTDCTPISNGDNDDRKKSCTEAAVSSSETASEYHARDDDDDIKNNHLNDVLEDDGVGADVDSSGVGDGDENNNNKEKKMVMMHSKNHATNASSSTTLTATTTATVTCYASNQVRDNRGLVDTNTAQNMNQHELLHLRNSGVDGSRIVNQIIANSATFDMKTDFSQAKYIARKQMKYQLRCRLVRCTPATVCEALYYKDARRMMNVREDTLGQLLSYANVCAGCTTLVYETCMGVVTGAIATRMGGYGKIFSIYSGQQPKNNEMIQRYNLSFAENQSIKWIHSGDVFGVKTTRTITTTSADSNNNTPTTASDDKSNNENNTSTESKEMASSISTTMPSSKPINNDNNNPGLIVGNGNKEKKKEEDDGPNDVDDDDDPEKIDRDSLEWPCPLQDHTRTYLGTMKHEKDVEHFLQKRAGRFARKLTRHTPREGMKWFHESPMNSLILVTGKYDPKECLLALLPYLASSCPFVVYHEFIEPLTMCFKELQQQELAINLRLSHTWMREYQVLPNRTHPKMDMSQSGGFLLTGIKLDPKYGHNELDAQLLQEIRQEIGGRRGKKNSTKKQQQSSSSQQQTTTTADVGDDDDNNRRRRRGGRCSKESSTTTQDEGTDRATKRSRKK